MTVAGRHVSLLYHDVIRSRGGGVGESSSGRFFTEMPPVASGFEGAGAEPYKLPVNLFVEHLERVKAVGRAATTVETLAAQAAGDLAVTLTFDDGGTSAHSTIAPLLEARGWRGHFFIATDYIGRPGFMSDSQIRDLHKRGHVIGSHSCSHPKRMSSLDDECLRREWTTSSGILAEILGCPTDTASVPNGYHSKRVAKAAVAAGIKWLFTSEPTVKAWHVGPCTVLGRYNVQARTTADEVAALVGSDPRARRAQSLYWNGKKMLKTVGGPGYLALRTLVLRNRAGRSPGAEPVSGVAAIRAQTVHVSELEIAD